MIINPTEKANSDEIASTKAMVINEKITPTVRRNFIRVDNELSVVISGNFRSTVFFTSFGEDCFFIGFLIVITR
jgi:hypothetical protein